ncbi:MAG: YfhO family protein [Anaerolineae bacterium]
MSGQRLPLEHSDLLCLFIIVILAALFLSPALQPGYTLLPLGVEGGIAPWHKQVTQQAKNLLLSDPFYTFYPRRYFFTTSLRHGVYPLWNPYVFAGHPVVGDTAAQTFYPPNLVAALFLSAARAVPTLAWFHLILTGFSMFAFLRLLHLQPGTALFGTVAWMLNGNTVVWLENPHRLSTLAWMPAIFLFYELALQRRQTWPGVVSGFLYGFSILGGHTQHALGLGLSLSAYAIFRTVSLSLRERRLVWRPVVAAAMVGLFGVGVGAVQLLPTLQLARMSHRHVMSIEQFLVTRWPLKHIVGLWIPDFYGNPVRFPYWGGRNYAEVTAYYGALTFPLSLAALVWSRRPKGRFFSIALLLNLLVTLGTPAVWLVLWLPWTRYFRLISLIAYLPFFGGVAAAFGLEAATRVDNQRWKIWATFLLALGGLVVTTVIVAVDNAGEVSAHWTEINPYLWRTGAIWLIGLVGLLLVHRWPVLVTSLLVLLLAIDLIQWGMPFNPANSLDILYPDNEVTDWLRQDSSLYRVLPLQTDRVIFGPNVLSVFGLHETGGYSSLMIERYKELVKAIDSEVSIWWMRPNSNMLVNSRFDPLFSLLNVKYILTTHQLEQPLISVDAAFPGCAEPGLSLKAGSRSTQTFRALYPGLNRVDVEFVRTSDPVAQSVRFLLWRDRQEGDLVADITADGENLLEQGLLVFFFAPVADSSGQTFVWALETEGEGNITVCQAEGEPSGQLAFKAYSTQLQLADIRQGVWIYENPNVLPRAYIVHKVEIAPDSAVLERLISSDFNVWTTVLIGEPLLPEQMAALEVAPLRSDSTARITHYGLHRVEVEAEMTSPGLLVLSDAYYPGWEITVDNVPASLLRVNYALRGVYLPAGTHHVVFRFIPRVFYVGLILTGVTLACGAGISLWEVRYQAKKAKIPKLTHRVDRSDKETS